MEREVLAEGEVFNRWMYNRLILRNQNVLGCDTGPTGSGKSYRQLRMMELWYQFYFKSEVPEHAIQFEPYEVIKLIASDKLRRGDIIMFEEAGVGLNNLDFAKRHAKMMNYVLQTFRFKNYAMFFNLPYATLLNKTARMLMHFSFESASIDRTKKINYCKPKFLQVNQSSGKVYTKYPVAKVGKRYVKMKRLGYSMPSPYLVKMYEQKKSEFFDNMTKGMIFDIEKIKQQEMKEHQPERLSKNQETIYNLVPTVTCVAELVKKTKWSQAYVYELLDDIRTKGFKIKFMENPKSSTILGVENHPIAISIQ